MTEERRALKARRKTSPLGPSETSETRRLHGLGVGLYGIAIWNNKLESASLTFRLTGGDARGDLLGSLTFS